MNTDVYDILVIFTFIWKVPFFYSINVVYLRNNIFFKLNWCLGMYHVYHMEGEFTQAGFVPVADRNLISFYPLSH